MAATNRAGHTMATISATRAAWIATAVGIPLYAVTALVAAYLAAPLVQVLIRDGGSLEDLGIYVGVLVLNVGIVVGGIAIAAHTVGRLVFRRTRDQGRLRAGAAFAGMGALLAVPAVVFVAFAQGEPLAGGVYAALAIGVPSALTAGLTRAVLPTIAASTLATVLTSVVAVAAAVVVGSWAAVTVFGFGF